MKGDDECTQCDDDDDAGDDALRPAMSFLTPTRMSQHPGQVYKRRANEERSFASAASVGLIHDIHALNL